MFMNWLKWFHYHYIYAPKRMKKIQKYRYSRRLQRQHRRYENQIREVWRTNPEKRPVNDSFLLDERVKRILDRDKKSADEFFSRRIRGRRIINDDVWDSSSKTCPPSSSKKDNDIWSIMLQGPVPPRPPIRKRR